MRPPAQVDSTAGEKGGNAQHYIPTSTAFCGLPLGTRPKGQKNAKHHVVKLGVLVMTGGIEAPVVGSGLAVGDTTAATREQHT